jgi:16S rRNA (guanine(966)-N(2))-methyltransferase RsmD
MRISGGELKGRKIPGKGLGLVCRQGELRPTSSKIRESIFNILGDKIIEAVFVDLYAGTGAVGTEAMSRRANTVYFVEEDRKRARAIEELIEGCGCRNRAVIVNRNAGDFIMKEEFRGALFDIVFLDPPYRSRELEKVLPVLGRGTVLAEDAVVLAEHMSKAEMPDEAGVLEKKKTYRYGDTSLTLYGKVK